MRLWSISPKYLDSKGLVALWRESLLAKAVLEGNTSGYKNHPQLQRFKDTENPMGYIDKYLEHIYNESLERGYDFDSSKFSKIVDVTKIAVTDKQVEYEFQHLLRKLENRGPKLFKRIQNTTSIETHPIFTIITGGIEEWEKIE